MISDEEQGDSSSTTKMTRRKRIGEAVEESNDPFDCFGMAFGKIGILIALILYLAILLLPILLLYMGFSYKEKCPLNPYIPKWIFVSGIIGCVLIVYKYITTSVSIFKKATRKEKNQSKLYWVFFLLESLVLFSWTFLGGYLVFSVQKNISHNPQDLQNYCDSSMFNFAQLGILLMLAMLVLRCFFKFLAFSGAFCFDSEVEDNLVFYLCCI